MSAFPNPSAVLDRLDSLADSLQQAAQSLGAAGGRVQQAVRQLHGKRTASALGLGAARLFQALGAELKALPADVEQLQRLAAQVDGLRRLASQPPPVDVAPRQPVLQPVTPAAALPLHGAA